MRTVLAIITTFVFNTCVSEARPVPGPSYDELFTEADVIFIVRPGNTRDAQDNDVTQPLGVSGLDDFVTAVVTPVRILRVIKGHCKQAEMDLPHYRIDLEKAGRGLGNGPLLVEFEQKEKGVGEFDDAPGDRDYLLFMRRLTDGQLQFYTGHFDPRPSVFRLSEPTLDDE